MSVYSLESLPRRFREKVRVSQVGGCWVWRGATDSRGYGSCHLDGRTMGAHRAVYQIVVNAIPDGLDLDHLCRNRACVNPQHLEPVTRAENVARIPRPEECPRGHPLVAGNLIAKHPHRACLECDRQRAREQMRAVRKAARILGISRRRYIAEYGSALSTARRLTQQAEAEETD